MGYIYNCSIATATATNNAVYRLEDTDTWACRNCKTKADKHFMYIHECSGRRGGRATKIPLIIIQYKFRIKKVYQGNMYHIRIFVFVSMFLLTQLAFELAITTTKIILVPLLPLTVNINNLNFGESSIGVNIKGPFGCTDFQSVSKL